jgi:hypothetical protein
MKKSFLNGIITRCVLWTGLAAGFIVQSGPAQTYPPNIPIGPLPPVPIMEVQITSPANHAVFVAPVNLPIFAYVRPGFSCTNVDFYAGATKLGSGFNVGTTNRPPLLGSLASTRPIPSLGSTYCLVWTNAPVGAYALTAVARGVGSILMNPVSGLPVAIGDTSTSAPVNITIVGITPGTNPVDVVSITATDPVGIAGTNVMWAWPGQTNATPAWTNWPPPHWQYFTNWGPKNLIFTVRRRGSLTNAINVNYAVGGTASNGVDYAELPGVVNLPAGSAYGLIPVVPIYSGTARPPRTVVLTLTNSSSTPPDYVVGRPARAAGVIRPDWPRPLPFSLPDGSFHVNAAGPDGAWYVVQHSTDLRNWSAVATNQVVQGSVDFVDPDAPASAAGYYRTVPLTNAPPVP